MIDEFAGFSKRKYLQASNGHHGRSETMTQARDERKILADSEVDRSCLSPQINLPRLHPRKERAARTYLDAAHLAGAAAVGGEPGGVAGDAAAGPGPPGGAPQAAGADGGTAGPPPSGADPRASR